MVMEEEIAPSFNEQYEELQKNLVFTPSNTILWFQCPICLRKSATEERLSRHIEQKHSENDGSLQHGNETISLVTGDEPFKCSVCPFACNTNADLMRHAKKHKGTKPYSCKICGKTFSQRGNLKPHMMRHTGESPFQCEICNKAFNHKTSYKKHMDDHAAPKNYPCHFCDKCAFATVEERNKHEQSKHTKEDVDCIICGVILNSALGLKMHISQMHPEFPNAGETSSYKKWACQYCNKKFSTKAYLIIHHKIHKGEKPFKCEHCDYHAVSKDSVKKHMERAHGKYKPLSCNLCSKTFLYYSNKKAHMLRHYNLKPFSCSICNRNFLLKRHLTDHLRLHKGEKKFKCELCDVSYILPDSLRKHKEQHLPLPITCNICNKDFWIKSRFNKHIKAHNKQPKEDTPCEKPHKCHLCGKGFKGERFFKKHLENGCPTNCISHECTECGEVAYSAAALKKHMRIFHNLKEYSCSICAEGFKRVQQLVNHVLVQHPSNTNEDADNSHGNALQRVIIPKLEKTDSESNDAITLIPMDSDSETLNNVLVVDENKIGYDAPFVKVENSEVTYECYSCGEICYTYSELTLHQTLHGEQIPKSVCKTEPLPSIDLGKTKDMEEEEDRSNQVHIELNADDRPDIQYAENGKLNENVQNLECILSEESHEALGEVEQVCYYECTACAALFQTRENCEAHYNSFHVKRFT